MNASATRDIVVSSRARAQWFCRWVCLFAGVVGLAMLLPMVTAREQFGRDYPPAVTHPEFFYGFIGVGVAWQLVFLLIAADPRRYRPVLPLAVVEKLGFGVPAILLWSRGETSTLIACCGLFDLLLGLLFAVSYWRLGKAH